jgi:hypothetical protein
MKKVYVSFLLHGNMCYDRYTKQEIRQKFPLIYAAGIRAMQRYPQVTAHIDFPGLTTLSLRHHAQWFLDELQPLIDRGQAVMLGCQYAASHAMCADEESDLQACRVSMDITRDLLQRDTTAFFNQEIPFHPQTPYILNQAGVTRLVSRSVDGWTRPRRVRGIEGSELIQYPLIGVQMRRRKDLWDAFYDELEDGDFLMIGGDFEHMRHFDVERILETQAAMAAEGRVIEWMTMDRYEREVGIDTCWDEPRVYGTALEDDPESPSFSRWVGDPEDMIWHGHAVRAMEAVRAAGFAKLIAQQYGLGEADVPVAAAWTQPPDNVWDQRYEEVLEYPETETQYLAPEHERTLLNRAWHHLLIGINSDASGWVPWTPRTRHRNTSLVASQAYSHELILRSAREMAAYLPAVGPDARSHVLALNPGPARTVEVTLDTDGPLAFAGLDGALTTEVTHLGDHWSARARVHLPAYGYRLLGLVAAVPDEPAQWEAGDRVAFAGRSAWLRDGALHIAQGNQVVQVSVGPFKLSDPSGVAETEMVRPSWADADTRARHTAFGADLEIFTELAWTIWIRVVIGLREDRVEVTAEVHVDMPRRIGNLGFDPEGLVLIFQAQPGAVHYDIPYATIRHPNDDASYIAAQRFAALEGRVSFGLIALGGNQSFKVDAGAGILAANLGTSTEGRPDTRPQCVMYEDGTAEHLITTKGDPFLGSYVHPFALVFGEPPAVALAARRLRTAVPLVRVEPGGGDWPAVRSLLEVAPETAHVTAFRADPEGLEIVVNDVSGEPTTVTVEGQTVELVPYGVATVRLA